MQAMPGREVLIAGQGLAGTLLGWALEERGVPFRIFDPGNGQAASLVAAGLVNPITGRRLVKTGRVERLLPLARETYQKLGDTLGGALWRDLRIRRFFADERERTAFAAKSAAGELAPFVDGGDAAGFWIAQAGRVDLRTLVERSRARWTAQGGFVAEQLDVAAAAAAGGTVIDCSGWIGARAGVGGVAWEFAKGDVVDLAVPPMAAGVVLNRRHWVLPLQAGRACVGATHEPGVVDPVPTEAARTLLVAAARELVGGAVEPLEQRAGIRAVAPDKLPVAGWVAVGRGRYGVFNGLAGKGVLWAPYLAQVWADHLAHGAPLEPAFAADRFH